MKYIIGTKIYIPRPTVQVGASSAGSSTRDPILKFFQPQESYTLTRIARDRETGELIYTFSNSKCVVSVPVFECSVMDKFLAKYVR